MLFDALAGRKPLASGCAMDDLPTRRWFLQGFTSAMAGMHILKLPPPLCDQIYKAVSQDGRPYFSDPQNLGELVNSTVLGEGREQYHGHLAIGSCQWLGDHRVDVLDELCGRDRLSLELDELNRTAILDLMDQLFLHENIKKDNPAIIYAVDRYVSSGYFLNLRRGLSQEINFPSEKPDELKTSQMLSVPLFFEEFELTSRPPLVIRPAMWRFAGPQNPSARFDFHLFTNERRLFWGGWDHSNGNTDPKLGKKLYVPSGSHVTTFVPASVDDGSMMERVAAKREVYAYHELFQPVRFRRCLKVRHLLFARFHGGDGRINQVNVSFEPPNGPMVPRVMDINLRSQPFSHWVAHYVGLAKLLHGYIARGSRS